MYGDIDCASEDLKKFENSKYYLIKIFGGKSMTGNIWILVILKKLNINILWH